MSCGQKKIGINLVPRQPCDKLPLFRCLETAHSVNGARDEASYPYLRSLLKYNTRECLNVISLAFDQAEFSGEMGLLQRRRLVQILLQIVTVPEFSRSQVINLACFVVSLITSNNLSVEVETLDTVITSLTDRVDDRLSLRDHVEREQAWLDMLSLNKLGHLSTDCQLELALESRCYRVAEHLYELQKNYSNIFVCYLKDPVRKLDVFNYILAYINDKNRAVKQQFFDNFPELVELDSQKTSDIVIEHFPDLIEQFNNILSEYSDLQYLFLKGVFTQSEMKQPSELSECYLNLLCEKNEKEAIDFIKTSSCRREEALKITRKHEAHAVTALLLERGGEWMEALELLLAHDLVDEGLNLCVQGAEHLDGEGAQKLWLRLLEYHKSTSVLSLRQLVHAAAPHVPPQQLLGLVSDARFGDVKGLVQGMLADYAHDVDVLETTLRLLSRDLHHGKFHGSLCISSVKQCNQQYTKFFK